MRLSDAYELWEKDTAEGTYIAHKGKIKKYISLVKNDISEINNLDALNKFIFNKQQKALNKYDALRNFYEYIQSEIISKPKNSINFPIDRNDVIKFDYYNYEKNTDSMRRDIVYLDKDFNFLELFNHDYYLHISCNIAIATVKAALALGLGAGYDSGHMFKNNKNPSMTIHDIKVYEDNVCVKNFYKESSVKEILIGGKLAEYIKEYFKIRMSRNDIHKKEKDLFFNKLWKSKDLQYDNSIPGLKRKPYVVYELVYYMLKYISNRCALKNSLSVTDLRSNMVLHSLYNSKGSSFIEMIKVFGYPTFIEYAFDVYCKNTIHTNSVLFNDKKFYQTTTSDIEDDEIKNINSDDKKKITSIINQFIRDKQKVKKLKKLYNNSCQICGIKLSLFDEISYSEACHIQPLNSHNGIDDISNMLILCPNHHKLFDLGIFCLDPSNPKYIICLDKNHTLHGSALKIVKHDISPVFIRYHYENIFLHLKKQLKER